MTELDRFSESFAEFAGLIKRYFPIAVSSFVLPVSVSRAGCK